MSQKHYLMNLTWADTGTLVKVLRSPVKDKSTTLLSDFNFYLTGAVTALGINSVKAYDIAGNQIAGFSASLKYINN